ncbi:conjugative transposon protein TraM, partial [Prevotella merdae]|uniref:conjugative transposon protein TraM n=1 Tax=Prevotella merdae TaxID=2079531 RepID=UPI0035613008
IDRDNEQEKEEYQSKYSDAELQQLDAEAKRQAEMEKQREAQEAHERQRENEALAELNKALAEARLKGQQVTQANSSTSAATSPTDSQGSAKGGINIEGKIKVNENARKEADENDKPSEVVKKVKTSSDYFNTLAVNEKEPTLIKAIIDENIKAVDGSRVRLRLLDDVEIGKMIVKKGAYLYATMSGFSSQRVKGTVKSVLVDDEIVKINLSLYDTDGMEGLYVPSSQFRETSKDVASGAVTGNVDMNTTNTGSSFSQWGMQTMQNAYQKTSNAIGKAIKKNKVKLKYGTFVYLINSKDTKSK